MKKIFLLLLVIILSGCNNSALEYKKVADGLIDYYDDNYDKKNLNDKQEEMIEDYVNNKQINLENYIIKNDFYKTSEQNTFGVYVEDGKCYINIDDIVFTSSDSDTITSARIVCNGYFTTITKDSIKNSIPDIISRFEYRFLGYYESDKYSYVYRSYNTGGELTITVGDKITVELKGDEDLELKPIYENKNIVLPIIFILSGIIIFLVVKKFYHKDKQEG